MVSGEASKIAQLVDYLMSKVAEAADEEDWKESDGWVGRWTITGDNNIVRVYEIHGGKFYPCRDLAQKTYTGEVEMSEDTFLDLVDGALGGRGEEVFAQKYAARHIRYGGQQWVVDSERFRKVLRRLGSVPMRKLL